MGGIDAKQLRAKDKDAHTCRGVYADVLDACGKSGRYNAHESVSIKCRRSEFNFRYDARSITCLITLMGRK